MTLYGHGWSPWPNARRENKAIGVGAICGFISIFIAVGIGVKDKAALLAIVIPSGIVGYWWLGRKIFSKKDSSEDRPNR